MLEASEENRLTSSSESIPAYRIPANSEITIEGEVLPNEQKREGPTASGPVITRAASGRNRF